MATISFLDKLDEPQPISFAPNMTEATFRQEQEPENTESELLFPPADSDTTDPEGSVKRMYHGKKKDKGHIPRPPNAFILFRSSFIKQQHIPGSIEGNHSQLSKIVGACWQRLSYEERQVWERKAKEARAEHKLLYPEYKFVRSRNASNKSVSSPSTREKSGAKFVNTVPVTDGACKSTTMVTTCHAPAKVSRRRVPAKGAEDPKRCEHIARLLVAGHKGSNLAALVQRLDSEAKERKEAGLNVTELQTPERVTRGSIVGGHLVRRSSSCPPPEIAAAGFAFPTVPKAVPKAPSRRPKPLRGVSTMPYPPTFIKHSRSVSPPVSPPFNADVVAPTPVAIEGPFANSTFDFATPSPTNPARPESVAPHIVPFGGLPSPSDTVTEHYVPWTPTVSGAAYYQHPFPQIAQDTSVMPASFTPPLSSTSSASEIEMYPLPGEGWNSDFDWIPSTEDEAGSSPNPPSTPDHHLSPSVNFPSLPLEQIEYPYPVENSLEEIPDLNNYSKGLALFNQNPNAFPPSPIANDLYGLPPSATSPSPAFGVGAMGNHVMSPETISCDTDMWGMPFVQSPIDNDNTYRPYRTDRHL